MSNVRLYGSEPAPVSEPAPAAPPANPQAVLADATESFGAPRPTQGFGGVGPRTISLRRTGGRPFRFQGTELCNAVGWAESVSIWHEINLFRTNTGQIVVDIRVFRKAPGERDIFHVNVVDTIDEAIAILEDYNPVQDVMASLPLDDTTISLAELSLEGVVLRQKIEQTKRQYEALLGDLLHEIDRQR